MNMIIVSGASGVGKGTLVRLFIDSDPEEYELVRSVTTRKPRPAGDYYTFVSKEEFRSMSNEGAFLETMSNIIDRLTASYDEVAAASAYDSFIVNRSLEVALNDLKAVVKGSDSGCNPGVMKYQSELVTLLRSIQEGVDEISE